MRNVLVIEYDGRPFHGWQRQTNAATVQQHVETAIGRVADRPVSVICAGRTDAGVHARAQVVHFDTDAVRRDVAWRLGVNAGLPPAISVVWAGGARDDFHARFSAVERRYCYLIQNRSSRSALYDGRVWWVHRALDVEAMRAAAGGLLGEHDFSAFRSANCQAATPHRYVSHIDIARRGEFVAITIAANAFLQNMVRIIAGVLVQIGSGDKPVAWIEELLCERDRRRAGVTAPAGGLYLAAVRYASPHAIPSCPPVGSPFVF